jgi:hypothetical protein
MMYFDRCVNKHHLFFRSAEWAADPAALPYHLTTPFEFVP